MRLVFGIVGLLLGGAAQAQDLRYSFEWVGGGDYVMRGAFAYDPSLAGRRVIRETDRSCAAFPMLNPNPGDPQLNPAPSMFHACGMAAPAP